MGRTRIREVVKVGQDVGDGPGIDSLTTGKECDVVEEEEST